MHYIIIFITLFLFPSIASAYQNPTQLEISASYQDVLVFPLDESSFETKKNTFMNTFGVSCDGPVEFICKKGWQSNPEQYGCGIQKTMDYIFDATKFSCTFHSVSGTNQPDFHLSGNILASEIDTNRQKFIHLTIPKKEKKIFSLTQTNFEMVKNKFENALGISCDGDIRFICKKGWQARPDEYGCGFERVGNKLGLGFDTKCHFDMLSPDQNQEKKSPHKRITFFLKVFPYYKEYQYNLDISEKFPYKRLQKRALSCEISATADILSAITQKKVDEDEMVDILPKSEFYNKTPLNQSGKRIWGDPDEGFVGYIDKYNGRSAIQYKYEGYGVYEKPIEKIYATYNLQTQVINSTMYDAGGWNENSHLKKLLLDLHHGNYVQLWGDTCTYSEYEDGRLDSLTQKLADQGYNARNNCVYPTKDRVLSWGVQQYDGSIKEVKGINGEHAFYLLGYKGGIENPTHIIVWDTNTGKHTYPTEEWMRKWRKIQNRSIVIQQ